MSERLIGHVFVDANGNMTITPTVHASKEDVGKLEAVWRHKLISVDDRLLSVGMK